MCTGRIARVDGVTIKSRSGSIEYVGKGNRHYVVPLCREAREALSLWLKARPAVEHPYLFTAAPTPHAPLGRWTVHHVVHRVLTRHLPRELAAKTTGPHSFRHALGRLLASGDEGQTSPLPVGDIANILGHSDARSVFIYCRPSAENLAQGLERVLGEGA